MGSDGGFNPLKELWDAATGGSTKKQIESTRVALGDVIEADTKKAVAAEEKKTSDAAFAESEKKRMAFGSGARTLLTGPAGLESSDDEEGYSVARKQLKGM